MKINKLIVLPLCLIFLNSILVGAITQGNFDQEVREKDLPKKYQQFLNKARNILTDEKKEVFMKLTSNKERDKFIEVFWESRDPAHQTAKNEFKEFWKLSEDFQMEVE